MQRNLVIAGLARVEVSLGGYLNTAVILNTEIIAGRVLLVYTGEYDDGYPLQPGDALVIEPQDTSTNPASGKICTRSIWISGVAAGAGTASVIFTVKYGPDQIGRGHQHPVEV